MEDNKTDSSQNSSSEWRKSSFIDKLKHVLTHSIMADLTIRLVNGVDIKEYNVHSIFFVMASEVFEKMLQSSFKEGLTKTIEMKDVKPEIFDILLNYLYGQPLNIPNLDHIKDLTELANYYMIDNLKTDIINFCQTNESVGIACIGIEVAEICDAPSLRDIKLQYIKNNTRTVVNNESFLKASVETVKTIMGEDSLKIEEIDLFKAIERWIKHNVTGSDESLKKILIQKVRFLSMTPKEFIGGPVASNLLRPEDIPSLLSHLIDENCSTPLPEGFIKVKRSYCFENYLFLTSLPSFTCNGHEYEFSFTVSKKILLTHLIIYPLVTDGEYEEMIVIDYYSEDAGSEHVAVFGGRVHDSDLITIKLNKPLELEEEITHRISVDPIEGDRKCVNLPKYVINSQDITFSFKKWREWASPECPLHSLMFEV